MLTAGSATSRAPPCIVQVRRRATGSWPGEEGTMSRYLLVIIGALVLEASVRGRADALYLTADPFIYPARTPQSVIRYC
jgi:hypothetical protein